MFFLGRTLMSPVESFGRIAEKEKDPLTKLLYFGASSAIPLALIGNALGFGCTWEGLLVVSGLLLVVHIPMALLLVKRDDVARKRLNGKWLFDFLLFTLGALLVTGVFLWLAATMSAGAAELKASMPEKLTPGNMSGVAPRWGLIFGCFGCLIGVLIVPLFISPLWMGAILSVMALQGKEVSTGFLDMAMGHFEGALESYCETKECSGEDLSKEDIIYLWHVAASPLAFFMTWIIRNNLEGEKHKKHFDAVEQVRSGKLSGIDFVMTYCDGQISEEDIAHAGREFARRYYQYYYDDYFPWTGEHGSSETGLYVATEDGYRDFSQTIDQNYRAYRISQKEYDGMEVAEEIKNSPLRVWADRENISVPLLTESYNTYAEAYAQVLALARLPEVERGNAFIRIILVFVRSFNILGRYNGFIETMEREELYEIALSLWRLAQKECALDMDESTVSAAFDEDREW